MKTNRPIATIEAGRVGGGALPDREAGFEALRRGVRRLNAVFRAWRQRSRERRALARFDERMLKDIGLTRADAEFLINQPFWRE